MLWLAKEQKIRALSAKPNLMKTITTISIYGIIANLLDTATTFIALNMGKTEANPLLDYLFGTHPVIGYSVKLIAGTWIFLPTKYSPYGLIESRYPSWKRIFFPVLIILATFLLLLAIQNFFVLWRASIRL